MQAEAEGQAPRAKEFCRVFEGRKPAGLRHRDEEVEGRPWPSERPLDGVGVAALKAQAY